MRKAFLGAAFFALMAVPGFSEQTWTGKISDSMCGATHKMAAEHGSAKMSDRECTEACIKGGGKYVFVSNGKVYTIDNQDYAGLAEHAGHTVKLTGDMQSQGAIKVSDIKMVKKAG
jgi:hypothetical protein